MAVSRLLILAVGLCLAAHAQALELKMGIAVEPQTADPQFLTGPDNVAFRHVYDRLVHQDDTQHLIPGLALTWKPTGETSWLFSLRPGVTFHDGSPFTADDVVFSYERARTVTGSTSSAATYLREIKAVRATGPLTLEIDTETPSPSLPRDLSAVAILSRKAGTGMVTADYNSGKAAIGTGPFRFVDFVPGDHMRLTKFEGYWGEKPAWDTVLIKPIKTAASRQAALLAGDVDLINGVDPAGYELLAKDPRWSVVSAPAARVIFVQLDSERDVTPFATAKDGSPLPKNPIKDVRVRHALSSAINRKALAERILEGQGTPAGQFLPDGNFGVSPRVPVPALDVELGKKLLTEAGYPDGFGLTLHCPSDRFPRGDAVCQALAQMWTRLGLAMKVEMSTSNVFLSRAAKFDFTISVTAWTSDTGDITSPMRALVATIDPKRGMGSGNRGHFSDAAFDKLFGEALGTFDEPKREALLQGAVDAAMNAYGVLPLFYQTNTWATRSEIGYAPRAEEFPLAMSARPKG